MRRLLTNLYRRLQGKASLEEVEAYQQAQIDSDHLKESPIRNIMHDPDRNSVKCTIDYGTDHKEEYDVEMHSISGSLKSVDARRFANLSAKWKEETQYLSSINQITSNEHYLRIIAMGPTAIPFIAPYGVQHLQLLQVRK